MRPLGIHLFSLASGPKRSQRAPALWGDIALLEAHLLPQISSKVLRLPEEPYQLPKCTALVPPGRFF